MKKVSLFIIIALITFQLAAQTGLQGAWQAKTSKGILAITIVDNYMSAVHYNPEKKEFYSTHGGTISSVDGGKIKGKTEFNSAEKELVGQEYQSPYQLAGNKLTLTHNATVLTFERVDDGSKNIAGNWRITQREQNGQLTPIHTSGSRKTIKILSSTRFQWAAINTETGEFSGSGGGTYTFNNGIYTENIEFFSRDSSRVGMSLSFTGKLQNNDWYHSGKSSRGEPINEVWSRK